MNNLVPHFQALAITIESVMIFYLINNMQMIVNLKNPVKIRTLIFQVIPFSVKSK